MGHEPWAENKHEAAIAAATEDYFDTEKWDECFGLDESYARVIVTVHSPAGMAGNYSVSLQRVTKAWAPAG